jgi:NADH-ubiquinone oxidoreductase chain 6
LAILISILFYSILYEIIPFLSQIYKDKDWANNITSYNEKIIYILSHQWETNLIEILQISSIGNILYTSFFLWLILASIILLLAMVGAIIITIK